MEKKNILVYFLLVESNWSYDEDFIVLEKIIILTAFLYRIGVRK